MSRADPGSFPFADTTTAARLVAGIGPETDPAQAALLRSRESTASRLIYGSARVLFPLLLFADLFLVETQQRGTA